MHNKDQDGDSYMLYDSHGRQSPRGRASIEDYSRQRSGSSSQQPQNRYQSITPFSNVEESSFNQSDFQRNRTSSAPQFYQEQQPSSRGDRIDGRIRSQSSFDSQSSQIKRRSSVNEYSRSK